MKPKMSLAGVRTYLDESIALWRRHQKAAKRVTDHRAATCYLDAFQSVRITIFGEMLPEVGNG